MRGIWASVLVMSFLLPASARARVVGAPQGDLGGVLLQSVPISVAGGRWVWENPRPQGNTLYAVTCPAARDCYGVGEGGGPDGELVSTTDGGASWRSTPGGGTTSIACPTTSICYTVGRGVYRLTTADGARSWRRVDRSFSAGARAQAISCPSPKTCYALAGTTVYRTHDGGRTWSVTMMAFTHHDSGSGLTALACVTAARCSAVGSYDVATHPQPVGGDLPPCPMGCFQSYVRAVFTTDGWRTWHDGIVPKRKGVLTDISCPSRTVCYTAGGGALRSSDGGRRWTAYPETSGRRISCPSVRLCFASSFSTITVTRDGGRTWRLDGHAPRATWNSIACPNVSRCVAVGWFGAMVWTSDGGRIWSGRGDTGVPTSEVLYTITCPSALACYAGGGSNLILSTKDGGGHWSPDHTSTWGFPYSHGVTAISCPAADRCYGLLGGLNRPFVISTADGGKSWNGHALPSIPGNPPSWQATSISCPAPTVCTIVSEGGWILRTVDGNTWTVHAPPINQSLTDITCPDSRSCIAMSRGGVPVVTRDGGSTWFIGSSGIAVPNAYATASACPTINTCYLITVRQAYANLGDRWDLRRTSDGGVTWAEVYQADGRKGQAFFAIKCSSQSVCVLLGSLSHSPVGQPVLTTTDGGRSFRQEPLDVAQHLSALGCAPADASGAPQCTIIGDYGTIIGNRR